MHVSSNRPVSEDEKADDVISGSDVMGCRRPTGGVFKYVSSDTSHAEAFPVATPRGTQFEFPWRGTTPGGVQGKPGGLSKTPATRPTDCSLCCPQGDVSAASDPALADWGTAFSLRLSG